MNKTFRLSLLYLLLIIPQHGNSPIPRMESWMEMDQGDGFVDRDLTSSLTGAESFGSAHKNYQNALIRKKQTDNEDETQAEGIVDSLTGRKQRKAPAANMQNVAQSPIQNAAPASMQNVAASPMQNAAPSAMQGMTTNMIQGVVPNSMQGMVGNAMQGKAWNGLQNMMPNMMQYPNFGYVQYAADAGQSQSAYDVPSINMQGYQGGYQGYQGMGIGYQGYQGYQDPYRMQFGMQNKNEKIANSRLDTKFYNTKRHANFMPRRDASRCASCLARNEPEDAMVELLKFRNGYGHGEDTEGYADSHIQNQLEGDDIQMSHLDAGEGRDQSFLRYSREEEDDPSLDDSEYYTEDRSPALIRGDAPDVIDVDYSQINPHGVIYKREEKKSQSQSSDKGEETSQGSLGTSGDKKLNPLNGLRSDASILEAHPPKESHEITKTDSKAFTQNGGDMFWKANANVLPPQELSDVMRDSQRALEEVQMLQYKTGKPQYSTYDGAGWNEGGYLRGKKRNLDDRRNKREDEDEQKNMKTGSDEGGGEYEDEEGKGHNDEEEYYEEAVFSFGRNRAAQEGSHLEDGENQKLYKREAVVKDEHQKTLKGDEDGKGDIASDDYVLSLENAPVEHEDDSRKSSSRQGVSGKKLVSRKGVKIWDQWGKWSPCSVTCGVGRMTRWRHCIGGGCAKGEKEAQIKKCTNPACR